MGGTWRIAAIVARVIDGNEPTTVTKTTARSVAPNQMTASGTHATNGTICRATTSGRSERRANSFSANPTPSSVPATTASTNENTSRISVLTVASGMVPSLMPASNARQVSSGDG